MKAINKSWRNVSAPFTVLNSQRRYYVYPLLSLVVMLLVTFFAIAPLFEAVLGPAPSSPLTWILFALVVHLAYGVLYFVSAYCHVTLVADIAAQLEGANAGRALDLLVRTAQRGSLIGIYAGAAAALGLGSVLARILNPLFGGIIAPLVGDRLWMRWHELSYKIPLQLAIPVIAMERPAPADLFKRCEQLVIDTWGKRVKPAHGTGLLTLLATLAIMLYGIPMLQQGLDEPSHTLLRQGLLVTLILVSCYMQISALMNAIFALAAYRYATAGKSDLFPGDASYAEEAFVSAQSGKPVSASQPSAGSEGSPLLGEESPT